MLERLQKIISAAGVASRRAAEDIILEGRVRVNGKVVSELGSKADPGKDHIKVDGKLINPRHPQTYIMLNKPAGYITTMSDPEKRPTVQDFLKGVRTRVYPVGRLDYNTEGMLLLTNDGDFAHLITHPSHELPKTYLVKVKGQLDDATLEKLAKGIYLDDGKTAPARVRKVRREEANSWIEIAIYEGRKRQVRRMMDRVGHSVIRLKRVKIGPISLGDLPMGTYRHLTSDEVKTLQVTAIDDRSQKPGVGSRKPGISSQKSGVRSEKPGVRSRKPGVRSEKPGIRSRKPEVRSQKSGQGKNHGVNKFQRPPR
jgi:23S rRNA pseudouridine2605 synthase